MIIRIKYLKLNSEQVITVSRGKHSWTRNISSCFYDDGIYDAKTAWQDDIEKDDAQRQIDALFEHNQNIVAYYDDGRPVDVRTLTI